MGDMVYGYQYLSKATEDAGVFVTGGSTSGAWGGSPTVRTEFFEYDTEAWAAGPDLPADKAVYGHCMVKTAVS